MPTEAPWPRWGEELLQRDPLRPAGAGGQARVPVPRHQEVRVPRLGPGCQVAEPPPPQSWELCRQAAYPESNVHFTQSVSQLKDETSLIYA